MIRLEDDDGWPIVSSPVALLVYICAALGLLGLGYLAVVAFVVVAP